MPKPNDSGGGKNGGGGSGGGGETIFAVLQYTADSISGTGPAGQLITVRVTSADGTQTWEGEVTVEGDGTWSIPLIQLVNTSDGADDFSDNTGDYTVVASYEQAKGKNVKTTATEPFPLTIDGPTGPGTPAITDFVMEDASDTGAKGDGITGDPTVTFRVYFNSEVNVGDTITLMVNGAADSLIVLTQTHISAGFVDLTTSGMNDGPKSIYAELSSGTNSATVSTTVSLTVDTTIPDAEIGAVNGAAVTAEPILLNDATPTLSGNTEAEAIVVLYTAGGTEIDSVQADAQGNWSFDLSALPDGQHGFYVIATDAAGNGAERPSATVTLMIDTQIDAAEITGLSAATDSGASGDRITSNTAPVLEGLAEVGANVALYDANDTLLAQTTATDGTWTLSPGTLADGTHTFRAQVTDAAGNVAWSDPYTVTVDSQIADPALLGVFVDDGGAADSLAVASGATVTDSSPLFQGTAEANSRITVHFADGSLAGSTTADANGNWSLNISGLAAGTYTFSFTATDAAGNLATAPSTFSLTVEEPPAPDMDPLYAEQWNLAALGGIEDVWVDYTGVGVTVAVYDDGIEYTHVDLDDNYDASLHLRYLGTELDPAPTNENEANHGTAVAGIIAGERNGEGTVGIAYDATLVGVNIFSGPANINQADTSGFLYAASQMGNFDVVNHSWGGAPTYLNDTDAAGNPTIISAFVDAAEDAAATGRGGLGTIMLKAAGNWADSAQGDISDTTRFIITVGAYDSDGDVSWYSSRGANILVSAPSSGNTIVDQYGDMTADSDLRIPTTDRLGSFGYGPEDWSSANDTSGFGGTSAATPTVAGVVALMLDANETLGWRDVQNILAQSATWTGSEIGVQSTYAEIVPVDLDSDGVRETTGLDQIEYFPGTWNGADTWNGGGMHFSEDYGYGAVNVLAAVRMAEVWGFFNAPQTSANEATQSTGTMSTPLAVSGAGDSATWTFDYSGAPMDLEYVDISINLETTLMQEVMLQITSPDGTTITLLDLPINDYTPAYDFFGIQLLQANVTWTFGANAFRGEDPNGTWTVTLMEKDVTFDVDNYRGQEYDGNALVELGMDFHGTDTGLDNDVYTYTDEMLTMGLDGEAYRVTLSDTAGIDWLNLAAMTSAVTVDLSTGVSAESGTGMVTIAAFETGTVIEHAVTGDGHDTLLGDDGNNMLAGMRGDDQIDGGQGDDQIYGHFGNDLLTGGLGADIFYFEFGHGDDVILDFDASFDRIALSGFGETSFADLTFTDTGLSFASGDSLTFSNYADLAFGAEDFIFGDVFGETAIA